MNIYFEPDNINEQNIYYIKPIRNKLLDKSYFYKIFYSGKVFTLNSIYLRFKLRVRDIKKIDNKVIIHFNTNDNSDIIEKLKSAEYKILKRNNLNKPIHYSCSDQLYKGVIYINFTSSKECKAYDIRHINNIFLKVSGIWENDDSYGISYKFCLPLSI